VEALASRGAAAIKVALNSDAGPTPSDPVLLAICDAARGRGLPVSAHVQGRGQTERAMGAGVDELAHCPWEPLSDATIDALARGVRVVSTLDVHSYGRDTPQYRIAVDNLRRFAAAGGEVAYGTDLGNGPIPPGLHVREAQHLLAAGLSPDDVLRAVTANPIAPGAPADLIGLAGDPREDLGQLGRVRFVMKAGRVVRAEP
jgi:imidazolonepropionase-like amidohydrolase